MDWRCPSPLLILLLFHYSSSSSAINASAPSPTPSPAPTAPSPATPDRPSSSSALDPKQLSALRSIGIPVTRDPCSSPSFACDSAAPFRHLLSLRLSNCSPDLDLSPTAVRALSATLTSLSFARCPISPPKLLPPSLLSLSVSSSLRRLTAVYLSRLRNLTSLSVTHVPVSAGGLYVILSQTHNLANLTLSDTNLSVLLPRNWHAPRLSHVDLSNNRIKGRIPTTINTLPDLHTLNLSYNSLSGLLPDSISDLVELRNVSLAQNSLSGSIPASLSDLTKLVHLDLSSNQFNGSVPGSLSGLPALRYLNLENNNLQGVVPFNASFIKGLEVLKLGGNSNLCYNHSTLSSKLGLGIAQCDKYGLPVAPPPDRSSKADSSDYSIDDGDDDDDGGSKKGSGGHHGPSKVVLGVAIALSCLVFLVIFVVCISKLCR